MFTGAVSLRISIIASIQAFLVTSVKLVCSLSSTFSFREIVQLLVLEERNPQPRNLGAVKARLFPFCKKRFLIIDSGLLLYIVYGYICRS